MKDIEQVLEKVLENHKELIIAIEHLDELSHGLSVENTSWYMDQLLEAVIKTNDIMGDLISIRRVPRLRVIFTKVEEDEK